MNLLECSICFNNNHKLISYCINNTCSINYKMCNFCIYNLKQTKIKSKWNKYNFTEPNYYSTIYYKCPFCNINSKEFILQN